VMTVTMIKTEKKKKSKLSGYDAQLLRTERLKREKEEGERVRKLLLQKRKNAKNPATPISIRRTELDEQIPFYSTARRYEKGGGRLRGDQ